MYLDVASMRRLVSESRSNSESKQSAIVPWQVDLDGSQLKRWVPPAVDDDDDWERVRAVVDAISRRMRSACAIGVLGRSRASSEGSE